MTECDMTECDMTECDTQTDSDSASCILGNSRPGQKFPGLNSEGGVRRNWATQSRTVNQHFYLSAKRRLPDAVRRNGQVMTVFLF